MATAFVSQTSEKVSDELESELNGSKKKSSGFFVFPQQPTELPPDFSINKEFLDFVDNIHPKKPEYERYYREIPFKFSKIKSREELLDKIKTNRDLGYMSEEEYKTALDLAGFKEESLAVILPKKSGRKRTPYQDIDLPAWKTKMDSIRAMVGDKLSSAAKAWFEYEIFDPKVPRTDDEISSIVSKAHDRGKISDSDFELFKPILEKEIEEEKKQEASFLENDNESRINIKREVVRDSAYYADKAKSAYSQGLLGSAVMYIKEIKDEYDRSSIVRDLVAESVRLGSFSDARRFVEQITDPEYRKELSSWVESHIKIPEVNIRKDYGNVIETKEELEVFPVSAQELKDDLTKETVVEDPSLPVLPSVNIEEKISDSVSTKAEEVTPEDVVLNNLETREALLDAARDEYAKQYEDWETKSYRSKTAFGKILQNLGASRPVPDRVFLKPTSLQNAREDYERAMSEARIDIAKDSMRTLLSEKNLLEAKIQEYREARKVADGENSEALPNKADRLKKGFGLWTKLSQKQKLLVSATMLTGGMFVQQAGMSQDFYDGLRVDNSLAGEKNTDASEKDKKVVLNTIPEIKIERPDLAHFAPEYAEKVQTPQAVIPVEVPVSSKGFIDTIHNVQEEIVKKYGGENNVPLELKSNILDKSDVKLAQELKFYDAKSGSSAVGLKGETLGVDASGSLVYKHLNGTVDTVMDTMTGLKPERDNKMIPSIDFDGKKIDVVLDFQNPTNIKVFLDDKQIGSGVLTNKGPKISVSKDLKGGWFMADNEYERAIKVADKVLKSSKNKV